MARHSASHSRKRSSHVSGKSSKLFTPTNLLVGGAVVVGAILLLRRSNSGANTNPQIAPTVNPNVPGPVAGPVAVDAGGNVVAANGGGAAGGDVAAAGGDAGGDVTAGIHPMIGRRPYNPYARHPNHYGTRRTR